MIVCSCHAVPDRSLREAVAAGLSLGEIIATTRAGTDCGHCKDAVEAIVAERGGPCRGPEACPGCPRRSSS